MTAFPSPHARLPLEAPAADGPLPEQVALPSVSSLASLSMLWIPPDALAQTWGQVAIDVPTCSVFLVCALAFQGLASEASALSHYQQGQHARGRSRYLLHTVRELVEACRAWDGVVCWLAGRPGHHLPLSEARRASLAKGAREQVARLWLLQGQVQRELVHLCLQAGWSLPYTSAASFVPNSLSASPAPEEGPAEPPDVVLAEDEQEKAV